jgi:tRNA threonylcarbamoyladenosine modification (KEOPS) complex Cgi121 subunit
MKVLRVRSALGPEGMAAALDRLKAVAFRDSAAASGEEVELAAHLARKAFAEKKNIARQLRFEFLLWLCGRTDLRSAMEESAPRGGEFLVVVFSDADEKAVLGALKAEKMPLGLKKEGGPLALERISLSRVK